MKPDRLTRDPAVSKQPVEHVPSSNPRESGRPLGRSWWARTGSTLTDAGPVSTRNNNRCLALHGDNHRGVDWARAEDAELRHAVMLGVIASTESPPIRLLDFGCGAGHPLEYYSRAQAPGHLLSRPGSVGAVHVGLPEPSSRTSPSLARTCWKRNRRCRTSTTS